MLIAAIVFAALLFAPSAANATNVYGSVTIGGPSGYVNIHSQPRYHHGHRAPVYVVPPRQIYYVQTPPPGYIIPNGSRYYNPAYHNPELRVVPNPYYQCTPTYCR